ncbi:MAG: polyprenyl synthetase family protein [Phycisphaerales bacterium]
MPTRTDSISSTALLDAIETTLAARIEAETDAPPRLLEAARYAVLGGGKRLRPLLCLRSAIAAGGRYEDALLPGAAAELVHAFSLVHDDLPALDDDDLRRGRPTVHKAFDEATAVLAGDFLLTLALGTVAASKVDPSRATRELIRATNAMIYGQVYDTLGGTDPTLPLEAQLRGIHERKTGAMIRVSCRLGAIAAGASHEAFEALDAYGIVIGQMFQAVDDLLDETQSTEHLGKAAGKDRDAGKLTYPRVHGLEGTRSLIESMRREAIEALSPLGETAEPLRSLAEDLATRTK